MIFAVFLYLSVSLLSSDFLYSHFCLRYSACSFWLSWSEFQMWSHAAWCVWSGVWLAQVSSFLPSSKYFWNLIFPWWVSLVKCLFKIRIDLPLSLPDRAAMRQMDQMLVLFKWCICGSAQSSRLWPHAFSISHYSKPAMNTDLLFSCQLCPVCLLLKSEWLHVTTPWDAVTTCCLWNGDVALRWGQKWLLIFWCLMWD